MRMHLETIQRCYRGKERKKEGKSLIVNNVAPLVYRIIQNVAPRVYPIVKNVAARVCRLLKNIAPRVSDCKDRGFTYPWDCKERSCTCLSDCKERCCTCLSHCKERSSTCLSDHKARYFVVSNLLKVGRTVRFTVRSHNRQTRASFQRRISRQALNFEGLKPDTLRNVCIKENQTAAHARL